MLRGFEILAMAYLLAFSHATSAHAAPDSTPEICRAHDEKTEATTLDAYFVANLKEHERMPFGRPWATQARSRAKAFLDQRINDKRAEICADRLKVPDDIKAAAAKYVTAECSSAAVVTVLDKYMQKIAGTFDENRKMLGTIRDEHINGIKLKLFDIAKGNNAGLEGVMQGGVPVSSLPKDAKFEWIKQEASRLGGEAQLIWGAASPSTNPLIQQNLFLAREAVRAKAERDKQKIKLGTDGKLNPFCKIK